ncbi:DUF4082 domain-containing protein [Kribbella sp. NBC_01505]|uniref:DUF4082 domain-containing protein n=1 Tax=Kribbella sp. NBC_01505 TaxID=2903580 RepID=UPI0038654438
MPNLPRRHFLSLAGGAALATGLTATTATAQTTATSATATATALAAPPVTIPALREWTAGSGGQYAVPGPSQTFRVIVRGADAAALQPVAEVLKTDLTKVLGRSVQSVVQDTPAPVAGDIVLSLATAVGNDEGYQLKVGAVLELSGERAGVFHGAQTIIQWLRQATTLPGGVARDYPKYPERGFLVANSARFYTMTWWKGQINELAYLKMNMLWVYVGYEDTTPLSQLKEITAYAKKYNIAVVPQVNMPGHMERLLAPRPDLGLPGRGGDLDLSKDESTSYARGLFSPYLSEFDTPYWHLGSDEYLVDFRDDLPVRYDLFPQLGAKAKQRFGNNAQPVDVFTGFINDMNTTVRASNKQLRIWNDGLLTSITAAPLNKNVIVEHWVGWPNRKLPSQLLAEGYQVHNSNGDFLYYDPEVRRPEPKPIYDSFHPGKFSGETVGPDTAGLRGAKLHLWTLPASEAEEFQSDRLLEPYRALSQVLWGSPKPFATYDGGFSNLIVTVGRPPLFPVGRHTVSPPDGATTVWPQRKPQVVFYDDIRAETVALREGGIEAGTPGRTTWDAATKTATFTPTNPWRYGQKCSMSFQASTASGQSVTGQWSFTVAKAPSLAYPRSLWNEEDGPAVERYSDARETELGVRFRVDRPGLVLGVKFYKAPGDGAVHTGSLWSPSGQKLATATFTGESTMGWQEVRFAQPVRIDAGGNYTASYHSPTGTFGYNHDYFDGRTQNNGVLHTPTGAGMFAYGPTSYPNESYLNTNYWADVIFQPDTYTLWNVGDAPALGATEPTSLEMGVKFSSSKAGKVHGVRFFKGTHNTGTHTGSLWTEGGQKLASATFAGESGFGWQEVRFAQPVTIAAGTSYVISYGSAGGFSATENGLATARANGSLITSGPGIYALQSGQFPTLSFQNRNYFADVVFSEG